MLFKFRYNLFTTILILLCFSLKAQIDGNPQYDPKNSVPILGMDFSLLGKMSTNIEEDETFPAKEQYKNFLYKQGQLFNKNNEMIGEYLMRYNVYRDEMEANKPSSSEKIIFYKDQLSKVTLEEVDYHVLDYVDENGNLAKGYFTSPILNSNCSIYKQLRKKLILGKEAKDSYHKSTQTTFKDTENHYLKFKENRPTAIALNKNKVVTSFPDYQKEIKKFIKENSLKMKTEKDLVKVVKFYNNQLSH